MRGPACPKYKTTKFNTNGRCILILGRFALATLALLRCSHIRRLAEEASVPMPIIDIAHQHLVSARANGGDQLDWSSLVGGERISAGLPPFSTKVRTDE